MKRRTLLAAALGAPAYLPTVSRAQQFPNRPIRMVLPSSVGGSADAMMRALAEPMRKVLGQPVICENRPGASGAMGTADIARADPDGHTIAFIWSGPMSVVPLLKPNTPYDPLRDFTPISLVGAAPGAILAHPSMPGTPKAFIEYVRGLPNGIEAGNAGVGSPGHLWAQMFAQRAGLKILHVPYKGTSDAVPPLVAGELKMIFSTTSAAYTNLAKAGKIRIVAVASEKPSPLVPGVETLASVLPGFEAEVWYGIMGPRGLPDEVARKLNQAVVTAMADPEVQQKYVDNSVAPFSTTQQGMQQRVVREYELWKGLLRDGVIKAE
ncbi:MAG: tripartite tricarboxylate transporter substrate binding protein [Ramlibacter sp.]|nr:tripartite tricarboxylate transporter substrate binding protein [Ramlibacter sp.]